MGGTTRDQKQRAEADFEREEREFLMSKHPAVHYARNYAAAIAPEVFANPMVALSSPDNLTNLTVREQVTFEVNLSGLAVGTDFIFNLNTSVLFPSAQFQASGLTTGNGTGFAFQCAAQPLPFSHALCPPFRYYGFSILLLPGNRLETCAQPIEYRNSLLTQPYANYPEEKDVLEDFERVERLMNFGHSWLCQSGTLLQKKSGSLRG